LKEAIHMETPKTPEAARGETAHLGKSVIIRGELTGSEDLFVDGQVEGTIELKGNRLTVGPNGQVKANVNARAVVVHGKLNGNIQASDRVDFKQSAVVLGDVTTQRISIEDGAYFKGGVDIQKEATKVEAKPEVKAESKPLATAPNTGTAVASAGAVTTGTPRTRA
jgi:cytoskeletal protein CcmA (bactofilin family)